MKLNPGIVRIHHSLLTSQTGIFTRFNPVDIQIDPNHFYADDKIYIMAGYSELFDPIEEGEVTPEYEFIIQTNPAGDTLVTADRITKYTLIDTPEETE